MSDIWGIDAAIKHANREKMARELRMELLPCIELLAPHAIKNIILDDAIETLNLCDTPIDAAKEA